MGGGNVAMDAARCAKRHGRGDARGIPPGEGGDARPGGGGPPREGGGHPLQPSDEPGGRYWGTAARWSAWVRPMGLRGLTRADDAVPRGGSKFVLDVDAVIMSLGTSPEPADSLHHAPGLEANRKGCLVVEDDGVATTRGRVCRRRRGDRRGHRDPRHGRGQRRPPRSMDQYLQEKHSKVNRQAGRRRPL